MLNLQSRFSIIEILLLVVIGIILFYKNRNNQLAKNRPPEGTNYVTLPVEEQKRIQENSIAMNNAALKYFFFLLYVLPLFILLTLGHQIYLFF